MRVSVVWFLMVFARRGCITLALLVIFLFAIFMIGICAKLIENCVVCALMVLSM